MRVVEERMKLYSLSIQQVAICRGMLMFSQNQRNELASFYFRREGSWLPLEGVCFTYQFRRHFAVVVSNEDGSVIVEASLIQSRWDFLRLNWNKMQYGWFWPYGNMNK